MSETQKDFKQPASFSLSLNLTLSFHRWVNRGPQKERCLLRNTPITWMGPGLGSPAPELRKRLCTRNAEAEESDPHTIHRGSGAKAWHGNIFQADTVDMSPGKSTFPSPGDQLIRPGYSAHTQRPEVSGGAHEVSRVLLLTPLRTDGPLMATTSYLFGP